MTNPSIALAQLGQILSSSPIVLEIEVLPVTDSPNSILYSPKDGALAICRKLLARCFVLARHAFFSSQQRQSNSIYESDNVSSERAKAKVQAQANESMNLLECTAIMLLWEPNHVTAINWRRRLIHAVLHDESNLVASDCNGHTGKKTETKTKKKANAIPSQGMDTLQQELRFLDSLLTSPLPKHTKSASLWSYRLWLRQQEWGLRGTTTPHYSAIIESWQEDLKIICAAGERHPRNYYAWHFARLRVQRIQDGISTLPASTLQETVSRVMAWCLMHPRDISGLSFLAWLLREYDPDRRIPVKEDMARFKSKFSWQGESIEWFLANVSS